MATKKHYAKVKVWGENIVWSGEGPLMGVIQEMFQSVPKDNHKFLIDRLQKLSDEQYNDQAQRAGFRPRCCGLLWRGGATKMKTYEMHVAGPDDIIVFSYELEALQRANEVNKIYLADRAANPDNEVLCVAVVNEIETEDEADGE
jgi:hypothetical protein